MRLRILKKGNLGGYSGDGSANMPSNGEKFIDARKDRHSGKPRLVTCCGNCGGYSYISLEEAQEFIAFEQ